MADDLSPTWRALDATTQDLIAARGMLAELQAAERRQRITAQQSSGESSVSGRDRYADGATLDLAVDIINKKADIASLEDVRALLTLAIEHGVEVV